MRRGALIGGLLVMLGVLATALLWRGPPGVSTEPADSSRLAKPEARGEAPRDRAPGVRTGEALSADAGPTRAPGVFATLTWGSGNGALGRSRPQEGNPEAPMSLTVANDGTVLILDQVNTRLVRYDKKGAPLEPVPLTLQAPQDVTVAADGTVLVTDRLVDKSVALMRDGKLVGELPLEGKGLAEGGAATGVFSSGRDVYVEREHGDLVRVGSTDGARDTERPEVPGRPTRDGRSFLTANIVDASAGTAMVTAIERPSLSHRFSRVLPLGAPLVSLTMLDSDASGVIYLGALVQRGAEAFGVQVLCLDPLDGKPVGRADFEANASADETFRELTVSDEGVLYFLSRGENGPRVLTARCQ